MTTIHSITQIKEECLKILFTEHPDITKDKLQKIGKGSFSQVYKFQDKAIKLNLNQKKDYQNFLNREIELSKKLNNRFIIRCFEANKHYFIFEYCAFGNFGEYISKHKTVSELTAMFFMTQLTCAFAYLRENQIIHRDLKPENILLKSEKPLLIKLADFGFSREYREHDLSQSRCGSLLYEAPELIFLASKQKVDQSKCDIWSMGVMLYETLIGNNPFYDKKQLISQNQYVRQIYSSSLDLPELSAASLSDQAKDITRRMLVINADNRIDHVDLFNHPWINEFFINEAFKRIKWIGTHSAFVSYANRNIIDSGESDYVIVKPVKKQTNSSFDSLKANDLLVSLFHDNIVRYYGIIETPVYYVFVSEFCEHSLKDRILENNKTNTSFSRVDIIELFNQILNGVKYLSEKKIFLGNLNLSNVMISNNTAKVSNYINFIFQREKNDKDIFFNKHNKNEDEKQKHTPKNPNDIFDIFTPPEVVNEPSKVVLTETSDVWSLGIIFQSLVLGKSPSKVKIQQIVLNQTYDTFLQKSSQKIMIKFGKNWSTFFLSMCEIDPSARCSIQSLSTSSLSESSDSVDGNQDSLSKNMRSSFSMSSLKSVSNVILPFGGSQDPKEIKSKLRIAFVVRSFVESEIKKNTITHYHSLILLIESLNLLESIQLLWNENTRDEYTKSFELLGVIYRQFQSLPKPILLISKEQLFFDLAHKMLREGCELEKVYIDSVNKIPNVSTHNANHFLHKIRSAYRKSISFFELFFLTEATIFDRTEAKTYLKATKERLKYYTKPKKE